MRPTKSACHPLTSYSSSKEEEEKVSLELYLALGLLCAVGYVFLSYKDQCLLGRGMNGRLLLFVGSISIVISWPIVLLAVVNMVIVALSCRWLDIDPASIFDIPRGGDYW